MGGILRGLQTTDNPIGNYLQERISQGKLIKDSIIAELRGVFMETIEEGELILGDGVFRQLNQTLRITEKMRDKNRLFKVFHLEIPDEEVIKRIQSRLLCSSCGNSFSKLADPQLEVGVNCPECWGRLILRSDDANQEAVTQRIKSFYAETLPALERLSAQGLLIKINGMQSSEAVFQEILSHCHPEKTLISGKSS